jgi:hypothetical protein
VTFSYSGKYKLAYINLSQRFISTHTRKSQSLTSRLTSQPVVRLLNTSHLKGAVGIAGPNPD